MSPHRRPPTMRPRRRPHRAAASGIVALTAATVAAPSAYLSVITVLGLLARPTAPVGATATPMLVHATRTRLSRPAGRCAIDYDKLLTTSSPTTAPMTRPKSSNAPAGPTHDRSAPTIPARVRRELALDRLARTCRFDEIVAVDADTTVNRPPISTGVDHSAGRRRAGLLLGHDAAQSPAATYRFAALACRHHLRPLGRSRLGGSSGLYGNGMMSRGPPSPAGAGRAIWSRTRVAERAAARR